MGSYIVWFTGSIGQKLIDFVKPAFIFVYLFIIANLMVTTLLGLHYLTDRIHRPPDGPLYSGSGSSEGRE